MLVCDFCGITDVDGGECGSVLEKYHNMKYRTSMLEGLHVCSSCGDDMDASYYKHMEPAITAFRDEWSTKKEKNLQRIRGEQD